MRALFTILILSSLTSLFGQSCFPGGITFSNQAQIDSFIIKNPTCISIGGNVVVNGSNITSLRGLRNIQKINGDFTFLNNTSLTSLDNLSALSVIKGNFVIDNNPLISGINPLGVDSVYGSITVKNNLKLRFIEAFVDLRYLQSSLILNNNPFLENISDFNLLTKINKDFEFSDMDSISTAYLGFANITEVGGNFSINENFLLNDIQSLENLSKIKGSFYVIGNESLQDLTYFKKIKTVETGISLQNNKSITSLFGLDNVKINKGFLEIGNNQNLVDLSSLDSITAISGSLSIYGNNKLNNLDGLSELREITSDLLIQFNQSLEDIAGLTKLKKVKNISILGNQNLLSLVGLDSLDVSILTNVEVAKNPNLVVCNSFSMCQYITLCKPALIYNNAENCKNLGQVRVNCGLSPKFSEFTIVGCDSVVFNGLTYLEGGFYNNVIPNTGNGQCDSVVLLTLIINRGQFSEKNISACDSFVYNNKKFFDNQSFVEIFTDANSCDSTVTINYTVNNSFSNYSTQSSCLPIIFFGDTISQSGIYERNFSSANSCDSTYVLDFTLINGGLSYGTDTIESCSALIINGDTLSQSGSYTQLLTNSSGCDSILTLVFYKLEPSITEIGVTVCENYVLNGTVYNMSGTYTQILEAANGCDSIINLTLVIKDGSNSLTTITDKACEVYFFNGKFLLQSGVYVANYINKFGCDSTVILNLTINNGTEDTLFVNTCGQYILNGTPYFSSGTYIQFLLNDKGCDSALYLVLNIRPGQNSTSIVSANSCGPYAYHGKIYDKSGTYTQIIPNASGCDSIITLKLIVRPVYNITLKRTACDSFVYNNNTYRSSGIYSNNLLTNAGCDSIVNLDLTIIHPSFSSFTVTQCGGYTFNNILYETSGVYKQILPNDVGCDSIITLNLTILPGENTVNFFTINSCDAIILNGIEYDTSGRYTQNLTSSTGCDSILTFTLNILSPGYDTIEAASCGPFSLNGLSYSSSGVYTQKLTSVFGCDSFLTIYLLIKQNSETILDIKSCDSYELNGVIYTNSGTYIQKFVNGVGCDSIVRLNLTIENLEASIIEEGGIFKANVADGIYQWIDCSTGLILPDQNKREFFPNVSGNFAVIIEKGLCKDTSLCSLITSIHNEEANHFVVFPNPSNGNFTIDFNATLKASLIEIFNSAGSLVLNKKSAMSEREEISISLSSGIYYLVVTTKEGNVSAKTLLIE